ncbi:MAG: lipoprotein [Endozoicomonadaceae bacterium]|nr:lipoprotein [Endozoicomonadaceae bacterium]
MQRIMVLIILGLVLSACGQTGPLYLPETPHSLQASISILVPR